MLRLNRGRIIGLALTGFIIYFLFLSSTNSNSDFRKRTEEGLSRRHGILQGDISDEAYRAQTNAQLNDVLSRQQQQEKPLRASDEGAGPKKQEAQRPGSDNDDGKSDETAVAGRKTMQKDRDQPKYPKEAAAGTAQKGLKEKNKGDGEGDTAAAGTERKKVVADPARDIAREKLQEYLKKPIVIFSKSHCPHSKKAKELLLSIYKITPTPIVVELDQLTDRLPPPPKPQPHEPHSDDEPPAQGPTLGQKIQEILGEITGRRTVPNIVVGGTKSIGGNDLVWEMHDEGSLKETILALGGKRIVGVEEVGLADGEKRR